MDEQGELDLVVWSLVAYLERCFCGSTEWCEHVAELAGRACGCPAETGRLKLRSCAEGSGSADDFVVVWRAEHVLRDFQARDEDAVVKLLREVLAREGTYEARTLAVLKDAAAAAGIEWRLVASACESGVALSNGCCDRDDRRPISKSRVPWVRVSFIAAGGGLALAVSGGAAAPSLAASIAATVSFGAAAEAGLTSCITGVFGALGASVSGFKATRRFCVDSSLALEAVRPRRCRAASQFVLVPGWGGAAGDAWGSAHDKYDWWTESCGDAGATKVGWAPDALARLYEAMRDASVWIEARDRAARGLIDELLRRSALGACSLPLALLERAASLDDPWAVAVKHADVAGVELAHKLLAKPRPRPAVTLVGYSVGARLVMRCLEELADRLAEKGDEDGAGAVVENVVFIGAPIAARPSRFRKARTVVSGRIVNAYSKNDWMLKLVYRSKAWSFVGVAGAQPVPPEGHSRDPNLACPGLENLDVTDLVNGHLVYPHVMPQIFAKLNFERSSATIVAPPPSTPPPPLDSHHLLAAEIKDELPRRSFGSLDIVDDEDGDVMVLN